MHGLVELFMFLFFLVKRAAVAGGHVLRGAFKAEGCGLEVCTAWIWILALPLTICITLRTSTL